MTFKELVERVGGVMVAGGVAGGEGRQVAHVVVSDLMSDVLLVDEEDMILLTSLASDQVLRTAQIVGAVGVIVVNGKTLPSSMAGVAKELGMGLATCAKSKYDTCIAVYKALN